MHQTRWQLVVTIIETRVKVAVTHTIDLEEYRLQ